MTPEHANQLIIEFDRAKAARRLRLLGVITVKAATDRPTLTVEQAASYLGVSRGSAYKAVERGEIPSIQIGKRLLVPTATLRQLLGLDQPDTAETVSVAP